MLKYSWYKTARSWMFVAWYFIKNSIHYNFAYQYISIIQKKLRTNFVSVYTQNIHSKKKK